MRMIRRRWWVLAMLAIVGGTAGYLISQRANQTISPLFEATARIEFESEDGARSKDPVLEALAAAREEARIYNTAALEEGLGRIEVDQQRQWLTFTSRSADRTEAAANAEMMRSAYVNGTAQARAAARQQRLEEITAEASDVLAQIEALTPEVTVETAPTLSPGLQARVDELTSLHDALDQNLTNLKVSLVLAEGGDDRAGDPDELREQIENLEFRTASIRSEIAVIALENGIDPVTVVPKPGDSQTQGGQSQNPDPPQSNQNDPRSATPTTTPEGGLTDQLTLDALEDRYNELTSEFGDLFLEAENETAPELPPVEITDLTPAPVSAPLNAALGALAGALLAVGILFATKSATGAIYGPADVHPLPVLAELPTAASMRNDERATARRSDGIRQLRHTMLRYADGSDQTLAIGFSGVNVPDGEVSQLTVDVGNRLSASDRRILVLDLNFGTTVRYDGDSGVTVAKLLQALRSDPEAGPAYFTDTLLGGANGSLLRVVAPGRLQGDPTDAVLTEGFAHLMRVARDHFDLILAVMPPASDELTQALRQRLDGVIAVVIEKQGKRSELEHLIADSDAGLAPALGVALLSGQAKPKTVDRLKAALIPKPRGKRAEAPQPRPQPTPAPAPRPADPAPIPAEEPAAASTERAIVATPAKPAQPAAAPARRPLEPVEVDVKQSVPDMPRPSTRTRAFVDWIKAWPYNDMDPLPSLPNRPQLSPSDDGR